MIGIFDSGVGGLTVLRAMRETLPSANVLYFGDTKNAPYGVRTREELALLTMNGLKLLHSRGVHNIVSACNSVSASLAISLFETLSIVPTQLIEMVGPAVGFFKGSDARLVLCATPATIQSGIYQNGFRMIGKDVECIPIEKLAGAIEVGALEEEIESIIADALSVVTFAKDDVLILACTHYPLAKHVFRKVIGEDVLIFDPAYPVAERAQKLFWPQEVADGKTNFLLSRESDTFRTLVSQIFPKQEYTIEVLE